MGKPKKGKKGKQDDDFGDDEVEIDVLAMSETADEVLPQKTSKQKKGKKNKQENWEDDLDSKMYSPTLTDEVDAEIIDNAVLPQKQKKKDKKKTKKQEESDEEEEEAHIIVKKDKGMSAFAMLDMEEDSFGSSENEETLVRKPVKINNVQREDSIDDKETKSHDGGENNKQKQQKKGKKDKKKKKNEEEDLDALLAEIEGKTAQSQGIDFKDTSAMTEEEMLKAMEAEYEDDEDKKKKKAKKKKGGKQSEEVEESTVTEDTETPGEIKEDTEMTAAQKKKEKKERQKQKKAEEKAKQKDKKSKTEETAETPTEEKTEPEVMEVEQKQEDIPAEKAAEGETAEQPEGEEDEDSKKKKKKDRKKKKGEKEEEKESKKKTSKLGKMILEQQKKLREEEERIRLEMEEKERKIEEARRQKEEKEKREKERKEREKQKKKEKIERQKKEGTFLTAKQKEAQRIAQQKLEAMKAQGFEVPSEEPVKKKRPVYDTKKKKKQEMTSQISQEKEDEKAAGMETDEQVKDQVKDTLEGSKEEKEEVKDAWDASDEEDDVKDAWDQESEEEVEQDKTADEPEDKAGVDQEDLEDESEGSEEEEESSDEESSEEGSEEESSSEDELTAKENAREKALNRMKKRAEEAEKNKNIDTLRAAVVCVLGHVDTGKTKILDKLRRTNVQDNEAGGITQQIGATNVPQSSIKDSTKMCKEFSKKELKLPGLLIIDTPGHESFSNLRTRGSSLCDIAILVVDIMHGLEAQTIESINLLKQRKCPFVVALNKVDRLFQWQSNPHSDIQNVLKKQKPNTKQEFDERAQQVKTQLSEQGLNAELFFDNKNPKEYISLVPTSAHSGDGMGSLIALICELTQNHLARKLAFSEHLEATVMEVKALPGLGTTIDVILVNGTLNEGDTIVVPGTEGPIVTQIRGLLMPQPMKELRVKNAYVHHKEVVAAQGVKIIAKDLDHSLAGLPLYVAKYADEIDIFKEQLEDALEDILSGIKLQDKGVFVQASTLGSLEALLKFLKDSQIPYSGINIGPVHKRDVMKASVMLDRDPQYAVILAFDVKVERDANDMAESLGIRIFTAEIIYHLFDSFMDYRAKYKKGKQEEFKHIAVFPCKLRVLPQYIFNSRDPIVVGVMVEAGFVTLGTPLCVPSKENILLGQVTSIEVNHKQIEKAYKGQEVCVKIENIPSETPKLYGRHFDHTDLVVSKISRESIDAVKDYFRDEMTKADWHVMVELKKLFQIL